MKKLIIMMILTIVCLSINAQINLTTKDTSICQGEYVHLNAQLFFIDGSWYDINGVCLGSGGAFQNVTPLVTTSYIVGSPCGVPPFIAYDTITITVLPVPQIIAIQQTLNCNSALLIVSTDSSDYTYLWNTLNTTSNITVMPDTAPTTYTVTVTNHLGCATIASNTVNLNTVYNGKEICVVTTDIGLLKNKVEWITTVGYGENLVNIYRENVMGTYDKIGTVPDSLQSFIDLTGDIIHHPYQYKISLTDSCGRESTLSPYHKTMQLSLLNAVGGNEDIQWTPYVEMDDNSLPLYYVIYKQIGSEFQRLDSVGPTIFNYNNVPLGTYMVGAVKPACSSTSLGKVNTVDMLTSFSNPLNSASNIMESNYSFDFIIYPNPITSILQIQTSAKVKNIDIIDMTGRLVHNTNSKIIDCSSFTNGVYFIKATTDSGIITKKLIKE